MDLASAVSVQPKDEPSQTFGKIYFCKSLSNAFQGGVRSPAPGELGFQAASATSASVENNVGSKLELETWRTQKSFNLKATLIVKYKCS